MTTLFKVRIGLSEKGQLLQVKNVPFWLWLVHDIVNWDQAKENMTKDISISCFVFSKA